jgi:hypothetical protein
MTPAKQILDALPTLPTEEIRERLESIDREQRTLRAILLARLKEKPRRDPAAPTSEAAP